MYYRLPVLIIAALCSLAVTALPQQTAAASYPLPQEAPQGCNDCCTFPDRVWICPG
jgi:hypothetical protein